MSGQYLKESMCIFLGKDAPHHGHQATSNAFDVVQRGLHNIDLITSKPLKIIIIDVIDDKNNRIYRIEMTKKRVNI